MHEIITDSKCQLGNLLWIFHGYIRNKKETLNWKIKLIEAFIIAADVLVYYRN